MMTNWYQATSRRVHGGVPEWCTNLAKAHDLLQRRSRLYINRMIGGLYYIIWRFQKFASLALEQTIHCKKGVTWEIWQLGDLIYLLVLLFVGRHWSSRHPLQGGSCHDCHKHLSIRIIFLYFYKYYIILLWRLFFLDLSCSFTNAVIATKWLQKQEGSTKPKRWTHEY